jgi:hypothetical protein
VAHRAERLGELRAGGGDAGGGHRALQVQQGQGCGELTTGVGQTVLQTPQMGLQQLLDHRPLPAVLEHPADVGQRHADPTQPGDQPRGQHLLVAVPAVVALRVDPGRHQHAGAVVEPQGAHRQPALPGHLADPAHVLLHDDDGAASTRSRVKPAR